RTREGEPPAAVGDQRGPFETSSVRLVRGIHPSDSARVSPPKRYLAGPSSAADDAFHDGHPDAVPRYRRNGPCEQRRLSVIHRAREDAVLHASGEQTHPRRDRFHPGPRGDRLRIAGRVGRRSPGGRVALEDWHVFVHVELRGPREAHRPDPRPREERLGLLRLRYEEIETDYPGVSQTPRGGPGAVALFPSLGGLLTTRPNGQ